MSEWNDEVTVTAERVIRKTDKAILVQLEDRQLWIPQSQISDNSEVYDVGHTGDLILSPWFAEKEGL